MSWDHSRQTGMRSARDIFITAAGFMDCSLVNDSFIYPTNQRFKPVVSSLKKDLLLNIILV